MAVIAKQRYKLDIAPRGGWVIVYASRHDDGAREIEFEITNQGMAFSIPASINVSVQGIKLNGSYFSHSCSYSGNIVTMALADDMTDIIGKSICVLKFTNSSQQKLATAKFVLNVDTDSSSEGVIIDTEAEEIFNQMLNEIRAQASAISADIAELQSMVGSPLVASTASAMTDHNKIYVYTGSESGYTNGNWYYWNGSAWTSGGVYNSTAFETDKTLSVENMAADAKAVTTKITSIINEFTVTATGATNLYLHVGDTVEVDVTSLTGQVNMYISGYSQANVKLISSLGKYRYTANNDGFLAFYFFSGASMVAKVRLDTNILTMENDVSDLNYVGFIDSGLSIESGTINSTSGGNSSNQSYLRTISYVDKAILEISYASGYYAYLYAYDIDGTYIGRYTGSGFSTNWAESIKIYSPIRFDKFANYPYIYRLAFAKQDSSSPSIETLDLAIKSSVLTNIGMTGSMEVYTVGPSGNFSSFTEMLNALQNNDSRKIIYVYGGEYDIFEEMGGANFISGLDTSKNWRDVNYVVPPNTTIIGVGNVILKWSPTDEQIIDDAHARLMSPLNLSGNCKIENINIICSNCRYGIHDETSGRLAFDGSIHEFDNVHVVYNQSTYGIKYAYGAGHNKNSKYKFKNCIFSAGYSAPWSMHDWTATADEKSEFVFDNCIFLDNRTNVPGNLRFSSSDNVGRKDDVKINGCVFSGISFSTEGTVIVRQGYEVTTMLCKPYNVEYSQYIDALYKYTPTDYLQLEV